MGISWDINQHMGQPSPYFVEAKIQLMYNKTKGTGDVKFSVFQFLCVLGPPSLYWIDESSHTPHQTRSCFLCLDCDFSRQYSVFGFVDILYCWADVNCWKIWRLEIFFTRVTLSLLPQGGFSGSPLLLSINRYLDCF